MLLLDYWLPVDGFDGRYLVNPSGKIKAAFVISKMWQKRRWGGVLKTAINDRKHEIIKLQAIVNGKPGQQRLMVHRIVCKAYHPNPENKPEVNHKDFNTLNNAWTNLEWSTRKENVAHYEQSDRPKLNHIRKPVIDINTGVFYDSVEELSQLLGISKSGIYHRLNGQQNNETPYRYA